jgi:hypothetical protein
VLDVSDKDQLKDALKILRDAGVNCGASDHVAANLRDAFRHHHRSRARAWWPVAVAASMMIAAFGWQLYVPLIERSPQTPPVAIVPPQEVTIPDTAKPAAPFQRVVRAKPAASRPAPQLEFLALPFAPPFRPDEDAQVIRVRVPRQSIRSMGLPVNEDRMGERVPADLLLGYDGVARGIRFVDASEMR